MNPDEPVSRKTLDEAVDAILTGMKGMFDDMSAKLTVKFDEMETHLDKTDRKVDKVAANLIDTNTKLEALTTEVKAIKRQVSTLQRNTPTRKEFDALKSRVYHSPIS